MRALLRALAAVLLFVAGGAAVALAVPDRVPLGIPESAWLGVFVVALFGLLVTALGSRSPERPGRVQAGPPRMRKKRQPRQEAPPQPRAESGPPPSAAPRQTPAPPPPRQEAPRTAPASRAPAIEYPPVDPALVLVLPFTVSGSDPTIEFMADGISEEVLLGVAGLGDVRSVPRASAFSFKDTELGREECARRLGAAHTVAGEISSMGGELRLEASLAGSNAELWSRIWNFTAENTGDVVADLIRAVGLTLELPLEPGQRVLSIGRQTDRAEAQRHYLQGRYYWHQRGDGLQKSAASFEQAVRSDTGFALAYAGRADAHMLLGFYGYMEPRTAFQKAAEAAEKALELDDEISEAWTCLGFVRSFYHWEWSRSEVVFRRAIELNPSYMPARYWYALSRGTSGHLGDWIQQGRTSIKIDPLAPHALTHLGWALLESRAHDEAEEVLDRALTLDPEFSLGHWFRGRARLHRGDTDSALADLAASAKLSRGNPITLGTLGYAMARSGRTGDAQRILDELEAGPARWRWVRPSQVATVQLGLGRAEAALESLERGLEEKDFWLPLTVRREEWDEVRNDGRFGALLAGMGLQEIPHSAMEDARRTGSP